MAILIVTFSPESLTLIAVTLLLSLLAFYLFIIYIVIILALIQYLYVRFLNCLNCYLNPRPSAFNPGST